MSKLVRNEIILAKVETVYGQDAAPAGTDGRVVEEIEWAPFGLRMNERQSIFGSLAQLQRVYGGSLIEMRFKTEVKGAGAGNPPPIAPFLRACGLKQTIAAGVSVTYTPLNSGHDSITIYYYEEGRLTKLLGCRGDLTLRYTVGGLVKAEWRFVGRWTTAVDDAGVVPTYSQVSPLTAIGASTFAWGAWPADISELVIALSNTLATPPDINDSEGYGAIQITSRDVSGSVDPELVDNSTRNLQADFRGGTLRALTTGAIGIAGNRLTVQAPKVYVENLSPGDREGIRTYQVPFRAVESTPGAGDDLSIFFD